MVDDGDDEPGDHDPDDDEYLETLLDLHSRGEPSLPPPPAFGTVLDAPPPHGVTVPSVLMSPVPDPPVRSRWRRWRYGGVLAAIGAGALGFMLGELHHRADRTDPAPPRGVAVAQPSFGPPTPETRLDPCPAGMVYIDGGQFSMGTDHEVPLLVSARPSHGVEVQAFCLDRRETTVDEYRACSMQGECKRAYRTSEGSHSDLHHKMSSDTQAFDEFCNERIDGHGDHPINCVSWYQAVAYCQWRGARLPTEVQWEFAARGLSGSVYPWGDEAPSADHLNGCGAECRTWRSAHGLVPPLDLLFEASDKFPGTAPVGSFEDGRTPWGLDDMAGNVFEWTADVDRPYPGASALEAQAGDVERRVIRGGSFTSDKADYADPALRRSQAPSAHIHDIGFRCAADVNPG